MRLVFMGTPDFSVPVLQALADAGHDILRVYTQPPRPAGRGKSLRPSPVHKQADLLGIPVETPESFRDPDVIGGLETLHPDVAVVVAYGQILPQAALDAPNRGCLNIHASLLPRWRGAAPIHRAIMAGDSETGVGVMQMEAGLDTGPVLAEARTPINPDDTTGTLHDRLSIMGADLIVQTLASLDTLTPVPQPDDGVTYAAKIDKAEARVDWTRPAKEVDCHMRGLSPFPGAWCQINGERVKILQSRVSDGTGQPGMALDDALTIACGQGAVQLLRLQRAGRGAQDAAEMLMGFDIPKGTRLD